MLISKNWLLQFTTIPEYITPEKLGHDLTMRVVEVEDIIYESRFLDNIFVGRVVTVEKHPNADKLNICSVDFGQKDLVQVVCGGSNLTKGMLCVFGALGARVRLHGEGDLIELKRVKIKDIESCGMICSSDEIGLGDMFPKNNEKEILDFSDLKFEVGTSLAEALGLDDVVYSIDNKSITHRPDLWGHYGIAREVSALYGGEFKNYLTSNYNINDEDLYVSGSEWKLDISVEDTKACPRYMGLVLSGIEIGESPTWLKKRLMSVGVKSINNVVDVTNFVMLELGQPMHAFDADYISDPDDVKRISISVRKAHNEESFVSLDEKEYELTAEDLVIAIDNRVIALAGVKGSNNSGVSCSTNTIILESANFDAVTVRRTATRHGLRTDASARYEKMLDPTMCELAMRRAVKLLQEVCPNAKVVSNFVDQSSFSIAQGHIELSIDFVHRKIGVEIGQKEIVRILESLGFGVKTKKDVLYITIPVWRATKDISIREDLVEEIARIYGYDNIPSSLPTFSIIPPVRNSLRDLEISLRQFLAYEAGYTEVLNYSFVSIDTIKKSADNVNEYIELENPIAKDRSLLRRSLVTNMLINVEENLHRFNTVRIFEIGKVFRAEEKGQADGIGGTLPKQDTLLAMMYAEKGELTPFFKLSTRFAETLARMGVTVKYEKSKNLSNLIHPGRYASIKVDDVFVGFVGEVHPLAQERFGIGVRTAILEVNLEKLLPFVNNKDSYVPLSQYPSTERDVAFFVNVNTEHATISAFLIESDILIVGVELFDIFEGEGVPKGKKSMAYRITYRSDEKTLEGVDVDKAHDRIIEQLIVKFDIEVR